MSTGAPTRILCIEDNPINWRLVQRLLSQAGYQVHWAEDGMKGFELALSLKPDLVLLDINLPGLSGFETATKFRQQAELRTTPIVALTAKTLKSDRETALVAGCDGFIPKPIDPFTFVGQVRSYLGGQREQVDSGREGPLLRSLSAQMVEHLEAQLRAAQDSNTKLLAAQKDLEERNQSLARLVQLSHGLLTERDPQHLNRRILEQVQAELRAARLCTYWSHTSRAFLEGVTWNGVELGEAPALKSELPFCLKARSLDVGVPIGKPGLQAARLWEDGAMLGLWPINGEACLIPLRDSQGAAGPWGFWCLSRSEPFQARELEILPLFVSLAQVSRENAELIASLTESSRALANSYESMERAYLDLHNAKAELSRQERKVLMEGLFHKITQRLQAPVESLWQHWGSLSALLTDPSAEVTSHLNHLKEAVRRIDGLLHALNRRVAQDEPSQPEWIFLQDLFYQELELLHAEGVIPPDVAVDVDDRAGRFTMFAVYGDLARVVLYMVQHATGGPTPTRRLLFRTRLEDNTLHLEVQDEGGPIPPMGLDAAFEPFSNLHQDAIIDVRYPGANLPSLAQILSTYRGTAALRNEGEGTVLGIILPLG